MISCYAFRLFDYTFVGVAKKPERIWVDTPSAV